MPGEIYNVILQCVNGDFIVGYAAIADAKDYTSAVLAQLRQFMR